MELPTFWTYCENTTAANALCFQVGRMRVWYSYKTVVAYERGDGDIVVRENEWGPTTGKHLNAIDNGARKGRVGAQAFVAGLLVALGEAG